MMGYLETKDLFMKPAEIGFAQALLAYYVRNQSFLEGFEPKRDAHFFTLEHQEAQLQHDIAAMRDKTGIRFFLFAKNDPKRIIGCVDISQIVWGSFLSCYLGYKLDQELINQGYMTQAVGAAVRFAFDTLRLHRMEANIMPRNIASRRVLEKCGFQAEGISKKYLKINGVWEDHVHMVILNETLNP